SVIVRYFNLTVATINHINRSIKMKQFYFFKYGVLACLAFFSLTAFSQTGNISGTVRDEANQPLPGAGVSIKGAAKSTSTDANGRYSLSGIPTGKQTLVITFIGYQELTKEVFVTANTQENVQL